jgi:hypothetical protein
VSGAWIDAGRKPGEARALQRVDEALDVGPDRIALAGKNIDGQILADAREASRARQRGERVEDVDGELGREGEAAIGIGDIGVDLLFVAREPVELGARRRKRLIVGAEPHLAEELALAALAESQPLGARDQAPERRNRRRLAARAGIDGAGERIRMLGDEVLPEERSQRMAKEDDRNARLLLGDQPVHGPEIADDFSPSPVVGEMAEVGRSGLGPVAAMVVGVNRVARGVERRGEAGVAGAVLGEAVGELHHRPRPPFRQPAPGQKALPVVGPKLKLAPRHSRPYPRKPGLRSPLLKPSSPVQDPRVKRPATRAEAQPGFP